MPDYYNSYCICNYTEGRVIAALNGNFICSQSKSKYQEYSRSFYDRILCGIDYTKAEIIFHSKKNDSHIGDIILIYLRRRGKQPVIDAIKKLLANPNIAYAEPDYLFDSHNKYTVPNDPYFNRLWGLEKINAPLVWKYTTGNSGVVVGVTDSGIDYNHPDIRDNMWVSKNGLHGRDFFRNNGDPIDRSGHGTHTAGTIGAAGNNYIGIAGVCWKIKLAALKIGHIFMSLAAAIAAIDYANINNITILNNSWGGRYYSPDLKFAIEQYNGLFIVSAGNYGTDNDSIPDYPASFDSDNIISVAASRPDGALARFSNYGEKSVDIAAPGTDILSLSLRGKYSYMSGTSMAAPHVSGAAALLKSYMPDLTVSDIKTIILSSADKNPNLNGKVATGILNLKKIFDTV